jgi:hypothetical protein
MKYQFTVPPTYEMGSYSGTCSNNYTETYRKNALWDYNSARAHDGLPPLARMPSGTTYRALWDYDLEGNYGHGWEVLCSESTRKEAKQRLKEYRENEGGRYRIVRRPA